jgi:hypothetical protein
MRTPVLKTIGSFTPIALVGLAYLVYKEAPVVEKAIEARIPRVERAIDRRLPGLENKVDEALGPAKRGLEPLEGGPSR